MALVAVSELQLIGRTSGLLDKLLADASSTSVVFEYVGGLVRCQYCSKWFTDFMLDGVCRFKRTWNSTCEWRVCAGCRTACRCTTHSPKCVQFACNRCDGSSSSYITCGPGRRAVFHCHSCATTCRLRAIERQKADKRQARINATFATQTRKLQSKAATRLCEIDECKAAKHQRTS
jgi:hypothetical protein